MKLLIFVFALVIFFTSCEKVIELDLSTADAKLVIEGNITNQAGPYFVKLTKTLPFDQPSIYPGVAGATITISDNTGVKDTLVYTDKGIYRTSTLQGIVGRTYTLNVISEGKTYEAKSTMPAFVPLDTIRISSFTFGGLEQKFLIPVYTDPKELGNNYNFRLIVNDTLDKSYITWNDNTNNGVPNQRPLGRSDSNFKTGDDVFLEMQCVDLSAFNYYFTLAELANGGAGGGITPSNPPNNISGGALGLFSAHTSQVKEIKIP